MLLILAVNDWLILRVWIYCLSNKHRQVVCLKAGNVKVTDDVADFSCYGQVRPVAHL